VGVGFRNCFFFFCVECAKQHIELDKNKKRCVEKKKAYKSLI